MTVKISTKMTVNFNVRMQVKYSVKMIVILNFDNQNLKGYPLI